MRLAPGTILGPYQVIAPLGSGGMGEVYRVKDRRLRREVAVKVLPEHVAADPAALARFEQEARALAALSHPNIVTLHDLGSEGDIQYAVAELLAGDTLRARLNLGSAIPWTESVEIAAYICDGLAAAHARGIIHRDLKPENIFLTSDGRVKVLDFGLARWRDDVSSTAARPAAKTAPGMVVGTVGYMSPEQVRGDVVMAGSDLFSMGCLLFEMVSGKRAFAKSNPADTMISILRDPVPTLKALGSTSPETLSQIVARCLEKRLDARFASAAELAEELRALLEKRQPHRSPEVTRRPPDSIAVLPFTNTGGDPDTEYLSDGLTDSLIHALTRVPGLKVIARSAVFRYKNTTDPIAAGRELNVTSVLTGRLTSRGGSLLVSAELVDLADSAVLFSEKLTRSLSDLLEVEDEIAGHIAEALRRTFAGRERNLSKQYTSSPEAHREYLRGLYQWNKRAPQALRRALPHFHRALELDANYALAWVGLADCYNALGYYTIEPPEETFPKAREAALKALEIDGHLAEARVSLAYARHYYEWDFDGAERLYQEAIQQNPGYPTAHLFYSNLLLTEGRFEEALLAEHRGLEIDPTSLILNTTLGWVRYYAGRYEESLTYFEKVLEMDDTFVPARVYLGRALVELSRFDEAVTELARAVELSERSAWTVTGHGHALARAGRREETRKVLGELAERAMSQFVPSFDVAAIYAALNKKDLAFDALETAFEQRSHRLTFLRIDPRLAPLRSDPRYDSLVRRVGFPTRQQSVDTVVARY